MSPEVVAELSAVSFSYRRATPVLDSVSQRFRSGMVYAVTGASGCGKSTLLYLLGLMLRPSSGQVTVLGAGASELTDRRRSKIRRDGIGFVFQDALLEPSMTAWQNIREGLPPGISRSDAKMRAIGAFENVGLSSSILSRKAMGLSGGQAQRVAVVRALLKAPALVLADEPTGNLDDESGEMVLNTLFDYARHPGRACVIVTHDARTAARADVAINLTGMTAR